MSKLFSIWILLISLLLLASCSKDSSQQPKNEKEKIPSQSSVEFNHNEQTFHIIPLYEEILDYTSAAQEDSQLNTEGEYFTRVVQPFKEKAYEQEATINNYQSFFLPTKNVEKLKENTIKLLKQQEEINQLIKESLLKSAKQLTGKNKVIFIMPLNPENTFPVNRMEGVSGVAFSENVLLLQIDPDFVSSALTYAVAHEYHHTVNMETYEGNYPLMDSAIFEGKADLFARIVYPNKTVPWVEPLPENTKEVILNELKDNANLTNHDIYRDFLEGDYAKGLPMWSNYKIGFTILESYIKNNPAISNEEWTKLDSKGILEGSDYSHILIES
ncbi:DUF2268 domain-containing putative Zn-dependent protease [Bacillus spongiae]|uniref:DUF2268 domain-containing putative Zn-dependent protease n=1 Tax=Bacillus spongiae TaxID=2683610 RepID=A0ABU8HC52_9BACI